MNNKILQESADDSILQEDLDRISESDIPLEELKGKTVLVTGATWADRFSAGKSIAVL